ncbi:MAG: hypothetical protein KDC33_06205 [Thermoleophilia bacterium]|nr:hypothetical protein [Thermoleophilia bacterium]
MSTDEPQAPPPPPHPPPAGDRPGAGGGAPWWRLPAIALAVALIASALFALSRDTRSPAGLETPADQARAACDLMARVPERFDVESAWQEQQYRLGAAEALAGLAAEGEPRYRPLAEAMARPRQVVTQAFSTDTPEFTAALEGVRAACRDA